MSLDKIASIKWRGKLAPTFAFPMTEPASLTSWEVRRCLEGLRNTGKSSHSAMGATLWAVLDYLQRSGTKYRLTAWPGEGYLVELVKEPSC